MKAVQINAYGDNHVVIVNSSAEKPKITDHQVLVKMHAAAALPMAGVTAWQALIDCMKLKKGQKILIHGGAGSIGIMAIVATTVSDRSIDFVLKY